MAFLINCDGSAREVLPDNGSDFSLKELQTLVGGYIQIIHLPDGRILGMDEEGKRKQKPYNQVGTLLGQLAGIATHDFLVGDVLLMNKDEMK
jgi:Domain of unknown function (DUF3846)